MLKLFWVVASTDDGDSLDLFVWANDKDEAEGFWAGYYDDLTDGISPRLFIFDEVEPPANKKAGVLPWSTEVREL